MDAGHLMTNRGMIKYDFTKRNTSQIQAYIANLESTLAINKQMLNTVLTNESTKYKKTLLLLNQENMLHAQKIKLLTKERDDAQYKALINLQLIEDYKHREREQNTEFHEKVFELKEQLSRKEYMLQNYERRYSIAEMLLKKYAKNDIEIKRFLDVKQSKATTQISNVVVENDQLKKEVTTLTNEKEALAKQLNKIERKYQTITEPAQLNKVKGETLNIILQSSTQNEIKFISNHDKYNSISSRREFQIPEKGDFKNSFNEKDAQKNEMDKSISIEELNNILDCNKLPPSDQITSKDLEL